MPMRRVMKNIAAVALAGAFVLGIVPVSASADTGFSRDVAEPVLSGLSFDTGYETYLSDRDPQGAKVGWATLRKDAGFAGEKLSLVKEGVETEFDKGLLAHAHSELVYTDIQDFGYERFEAWVGLNKSVRDEKTAASVTFEVWGDDELLWKSSELGNASNAERCDVSLEGVHVLRLVANAGERSDNDHAVWADAKFVKSLPTPWLRAADLEFQTPSQATEENMLVGVYARTLSSAERGWAHEAEAAENGVYRNGTEGNDLTSQVRVKETNYDGGVGGDYFVTYEVEDADGYVRERTVGMSVLGSERVRLNADVEYLTTPFASFSYAGRDFLDEQGRKGYDYALDKVLHFQRDQARYALGKRWGESVYWLTVDFKAADIYMTTQDAAYLGSMFMDQETRCFHVKDWSNEVTDADKDGIADSVTFWVPEKWGRDRWYEQRLLQTEQNASRFLANYQDGMTDAQALRSVLYPFADWVRYLDGQLMDDALAAQAAVCGGNGRALVYLSERLGIKSWWVRTDSHAWGCVMLNDASSVLSGEKTDAARSYRIDLLARDGHFLSGDCCQEHYEGYNHNVWFKRSKGYHPLAEASYPFAYTAWPNVQLATDGSIFVLVPGDAEGFDLKSLLKTCSSVYDGSLLDRVRIDDGGLEAKRTESGFADGVYRVTFDVTDSRGNEASACAYVQVVSQSDSAFDTENNASASDTNTGTLSLWTGSAERAYGTGLIMHESKTVTFDVEGRGYTYFSAWYGANGTVRKNTQWGANCKIRGEVRAKVRDVETGEESEVVLAASPDMGWYAVQHRFLVKLPENTVSVTFENVPKGAGNNHAALCDPRFFSADIIDGAPLAPVVHNVDDGARYASGVSVRPLVDHAAYVELYRRDLPVTLAGAFSNAAEPAVLAFSTLSDEAELLDFGPSSIDTSGFGELMGDYKVGDAISRDGRYALVAYSLSGYVQSLVVQFQIGDDVVEEPEVGGDVNDGVLGGNDGSGEDGGPNKPEDENDSGSDSGEDGSVAEDGSGGSDLGSDGEEESSGGSAGDVDDSEDSGTDSDGSLGDQGSGESENGSGGSASDAVDTDASHSGGSQMSDGEAGTSDGGDSAEAAGQAADTLDQESKRTWSDLAKTGDDRVLIVALTAAVAAGAVTLIAFVVLVRRNFR